MSNKANYETDVIAWAEEQVMLLRSGKLSELDIENIAEEILDVGKSEQRELANRMAVLIAHLLKWQYQSERRSRSWENTIKVQRDRLKRRIKRTPSLKKSLVDPDWIVDAWMDGCDSASQETGIDRWAFPESCPWTMDQVLNETFWPDSPD